MPEERFPIKIVQPQNTDFYVPKTSGGKKKIFGEVTAETRESLINQLENVEKSFSVSFQETPNTPAVAVVKLKKDAIAKSHRPLSLLNENTCPIIGIDQFGELLTSIRPRGIAELKKKVSKEKTKVAEANISAIEKITPYVVPEDSTKLLIELIEKGIGKIKLRLFNHHSDSVTAQLLQTLLRRLQELKLPEPVLMNYGKGLTILKILEPTPESVISLAKFVGTQKLSEFAAFRPVRKMETFTGNADAVAFAPPLEDREYPIVGIIDSGTAEDDSILSPWRVDRFSYVLENEVDHRHGSFVAGRVVFPRLLHAGDARFPSIQSKFIDVVALPKDSDNNEPVFFEDDAIDAIGECLVRFNQPKVWNLSCGSSNLVTDAGFSEFAWWLDQAQDSHNVTFVIAAGNYEDTPLRKWPLEKDLGEADRICGPAESVRGLTVGSVAHLETQNSCVAEEEPSGFSRRGPGPAYIPKPEVAHYGGNCDPYGSFAGSGVYSFDGQGNIAESIGTSFSTPIVASQLAHIHHEIRNGASRNLAKALLIHSAVLRSPIRNASEFRYRGFGIPGDISSLLTCTQSCATLVFEGELNPGQKFEKRSFPIPQCFRTAENKVRGDFAMTLVYDPPIDVSWGAEYCRSNLEVSLGTYDLVDGERKHSKKIPEESGDFKERYEKFLIEHGMKWSPVKIYRKYFEDGIKGDEWRLLLSLEHRANFVPEKPQKYALIISMFDRTKKSDVYDEVVRIMALQGWSTVDLEIKQDLRLLS